MEYNITGNGVGFKSKNYFVPSSNTLSKENITEYEYDRITKTATSPNCTHNSVITSRIIRKL